MHRDSNALRKNEYENKVSNKNKVIKIKRSKLKYLKNRSSNALFFISFSFVVLGSLFFYLIGQARSNEITFRKSKTPKSKFTLSDNIKQKKVKSSRELECVSLAVDDKAVLT